MKLQFSRQRNEKQYDFVSEVNGVTLYADRNCSTDIESCSRSMPPDNSNNYVRPMMSDTVVSGEPQRMVF